MNKVALITLWIEPASHQIVKYTFDNVDFDFLPAPWLVQVDTVKASMTMGQPFPDVWLPRGIDVNVGLTLANGEFAFRESVSYHDYREATVTTKVGIPGARASPASADRAGAARSRARPAAIGQPSRARQKSSPKSASTATC